MNVKKMMGVLAVTAVAVFGTVAGAEEAAPPAAQGSAEAPAETISLKKGGVHTLEVKELVRIAVGDSSTADVSVVGGSRIRISGRAKGSTTLLVWTKDGERKAYTLIVQG
ncbi:pilus assembly protein N-terminal domain-containing protein [Archangium lansingense]|uniref:Pilus assembly protein N-terminal domain-containing protein n=1 Tax=Archangium lansingense TaxID=2995310 RepID=A0ABT4APT1_9BACT|nr:pilus assembly protein N-terminal domain-containing protein [Archangium lansinium]MCY1083701.1 pilus assembly protein N-terminal domain-containing protein [Archangium lansinium]